MHAESAERRLRPRIVDTDIHAFLKLPIVGRPLAQTMAVIMNLRTYLQEKITPQWVSQDACVYVTLCRPTGRSV